MAGVSEDRNISPSQKRLRTSSGTKGKKKRTATLNDLDAIECPLCFDPLTIPIFQCDNGHIACFTCLHKLGQKCATCSLITSSRNRALERLLELLRIPCPNIEVGCSEIISCAETSTHLEICAFTQRACPFSSCDFVGFNKDLYEHSVAKHCESTYMFECGQPVFVYPLTDKRVILKELDTLGVEIVVVECFDTLEGRVFYASCIGPGEDEYSYTFKLISSCSDRLWFESDLERVLEVSDEPPEWHFMLVPSCMCFDYEFSICINRKTEYIGS
ncbi:Seven-in-absentia protein [Hirschfeldia incana]|nr:Seven-in-absentia protein [Hirschfeldia incana]